MWIRSQDKTILKECKFITLETFRKLENDKETIVYVIVWESWQCYYDRTLGKYLTEAKALKVLDMIEKHVFEKWKKVFQMPQDIEVDE